ncbi:hypothetical protein VFMJ11_0270 [Aliivibrio fischeri MJ11]|uniref:Uncharacterized protein n=1 Tax=Aliivibrio fischeri (strain MJ11) TaxID=388396 RepID=B5FGG0_ALIFM|nr:hypothetical protein VFMJ11_0270 [Aliivibrio fischeri MJ11]
MMQILWISVTARILIPRSGALRVVVIQRSLITVVITNELADKDTSTSSAPTAIPKRRLTSETKLLSAPCCNNICPAFATKRDISLCFSSMFIRNDSLNKNLF